MLFKMDLIREKLNICENGNALKYGSLLRILRLSLLMNNKEFAKILDVNHPSVLDWENGRHYPEIKKFKVYLRLDKGYRYS